MKHFFLAFTLLLFSCGTTEFGLDKKVISWDSFIYPVVNFVNNAEHTAGWTIYNRIVPNPEVLINESILGVVKTLYCNEYTIDLLIPRSYLARLILYYNRSR